MFFGNASKMESWRHRAEISEIWRRRRGHQCGNGAAASAMAALRRMAET